MVIGGFVGEETDIQRRNSLQDLTIALLRKPAFNLHLKANFYLWNFSGKCISLPKKVLSQSQAGDAFLSIRICTICICIFVHFVFEFVSICICICVDFQEMYFRRKKGHLPVTCKDRRGRCISICICTICLCIPICVIFPGKVFQLQKILYAQRLDAFYIFVCICICMICTCTMCLCI